jgi:restriction endonuclease
VNQDGERVFDETINKLVIVANESYEDFAKSLQSEYEQDFLYVTTASLNHDQLQQLSEEVGSDRSLLVVCTSFRGRKEGYPNLTVKKIPKAVLTRCEWGHDDYSLKVENLPAAPTPAPEPGQIDLL